MTLEDLQETAENNLIYAGDTIADPAAAFGADPDTLQATADSFNQSVEIQNDEFGRTTRAQKIETGPFYAVAFTPEVHSTLGGLRINTEAQVLDTDGYPISGLYAAGEVTVDIQGAERQGGNTIPDAITFGRIAGTNAATDSAD
ncbi:MAG: FAD-binding protein [Bulleidia sp.]